MSPGGRRRSPMRWRTSEAPPWQPRQSRQRPASAIALQKLHHPLVPVSVAKAGEPAPRHVLDLAGIDTVVGEMGTVGISVVDSEPEAPR